MATTDSPACANALAFAARGHAVFPIHGFVDGKCTCGTDCGRDAGKHPHHLAPRGLHSATTDLAKVRSWFERHPYLNYGIDCATLHVVDIDPRNGGDKTWKALVKKYHDICGWRVWTGGGGVHILLGTVTDPPLPKGKLGEGIEFQAFGAYIVGVGSLHKSGKRYTWDRSAMPGAEPSPQGVPPWIVDIIKASVVKPKAERTPDEDTAFYETLIAPASPGHRRARLSQLAGHVFGTPYPNRGVLAALMVNHTRQVTADLTDFSKDEMFDLLADLVKRDEIKRGVA